MGILWKLLLVSINARVIQKAKQLLFSADQATPHQRNRFFKTRPAFISWILNSSAARGSINPSGNLTDNGKVTHKDLLCFPPVSYHKVCKNRAVLFWWLPGLSRSLLCKSHLQKLSRPPKRNKSILAFASSLWKSVWPTGEECACRTSQSSSEEEAKGRGGTEQILTSSLSRYFFSSSLLRLDGKRLPSWTFSNSSAKTWSFLISLEWKSQTITFSKGSVIQDSCWCKSLTLFEAISVKTDGNVHCP